MVNAGLSLTEPEGNSLLDLSLAFPKWGFMSSETNPDFVFLAVDKMVRCSDAKFMAFQKKKSSKKVSRETEAVLEVGAILKGEAIPAVLIFEMAGVGVEVSTVLPKVLGDAMAAWEPSRVHDAAEVADVMEAPAGEESPIWAMKVS